SKVASAALLNYFGRKKGFPCANLRLYSVYGPMEDSSRLLPNVIRCGVDGVYPDLVHPNISRDFVYIEDVVEAFVAAALNLKEEDYGMAFNIGSGCKTTIADIAAFARDLFGIASEPSYSSMPDRIWDVSDWYANPGKAARCLGWQPRTA